MFIFVDAKISCRMSISIRFCM